ncbi:MAG TPA: AAA family ATPase [Pyrinomonadaceae bacterium]|nr:AAA family ATPase [Pyrinomonadaceae bacterium]
MTPSPVLAELKKFDEEERRAGRARQNDRSLEVVKPKTNGLHFGFTSLDDLLAEPKEQITFVIDRMLPCGGFSILAGKPKAGKSTWARNLAVAVAQLNRFLDRAVTRRGVVIYLCLEEKRAEVAAHFRRMQASGDTILIFTGSTPKDALTALEIAIEQHSPALVIIDPLSRFVRVTDFNSYGEVTRQLEPLIDMARLSKCQTHIMALHHNGKGGDLRETGDALLGSTGFFGAVDTLLTVRKRDKARTIESVQRYGEDLPETIIQLDPGTGIVSACGDMKEFTLSERKKAVLDVITRDPVPEATIKELVGGTNGGLSSKAVRALFDEGKLTRTGAGRKGDPFLYSLALELSDEIYIPASVPGDEASIEACLDAQRL